MDDKSLSYAAEHAEHYGIFSDERGFMAGLLRGLLDDRAVLLAVAEAARRDALEEAAEIAERVGRNRKHLAAEQFAGHIAHQIRNEAAVDALGVAPPEQRT